MAALKKPPAKVIATLSILLFSASLVVLFFKLRQYSMAEIFANLSLLSPRKLLPAIFFTACNYLVVCGYYILAFRYIRISLPVNTILYGSFVSNAVSNNAGYSMLSSAAVMYRLYARYHVSLLSVSKVVFISSLMLWTGLLTIGGMLLIIEPDVLAHPLHLSIQATRLLGAGILSFIILYVLAGIFRKTPVQVGKFHFTVPPPSITLWQIVISCGDWLFAASALYVLLPHLNVSFSRFMAAYLLAQFFGIISQVPGGLGVFETILILVFPKTYTTPQVLSALVSFRIIYYLLPLFTALALLGTHGAWSLLKKHTLP